MKKLLFLITFAFISWSVGAQTQLWSMMLGGDNIFKMNLDGSDYTSVYKFAMFTGNPYGSLVYANNGKLYGMNYDGVIFSYNPYSNIYNTVYYLDWSTGVQPYGNLIQASNGLLYGMNSYGGDSTYGKLFSVDLTNSFFTSLFNFGAYTGCSPQGSLVQTTNGKLYGMSPCNNGQIFSYNIDSSILTVLYNFDTVSGYSPRGSLMQATNSILYGLASVGGSHNLGVIFSFDPLLNIYTDLFNFDTINGSYPEGNLIQATDGKLYGMTGYGGTNRNGVIFKYDITTNTYNKLYDFNYINGSGPYGSLFQASNGKLYGMTEQGGVDSLGVIFSFDLTDSSFTKLKDLSLYNSDGTEPQYSNFIEIPTTPTLGINNLQKQPTLTLSPNPSSTSINFTLSSFTPNQQILITDVLGREISKSLIVNPQSSINISEWNNGVYFYQLINNKDTEQGKFVVNH